MPDDTIISKVFTFIAGSAEAGDDKQVLLKQQAKEILQNKYAKFYRVRQEEADPSLAQYFYSIYKIVFPARTFLHDPAVMAKVKQITLEAHLDKAVMDVIKRLTREVVAERKRMASPDEFSAELEKDLAALTVGFDSPKLSAADRVYDLMVNFSRFALWDYPPLLKKFDPDFRDDFSVPPKFNSLRADLIMADIASFCSVLPSFDPNDDWKTVFEIFKYCNRGTDLLSPDMWKGLLANLKDLKQSKMLDLIIRQASGNPVWEVKPAPDPDEQLSSRWLAEKSADVRQVISGIADNQKNVQIAGLVKAVFGASETTRLIYYTKEKGRILVQKEVESYIYAPALNHMEAFIQDFIKKEMQELADILLVRGQWTKNSASIAMSDAYHSILEITPEINALDETLSDEGTNGPRIRGALLRIDRDPSQAKYLDSIVGMLNEEALTIINKAVPAFVVIGKNLKMLMDDCQKKQYELIMNWKELAQVTRVPMAQRLGDNYKKVNYFIQLMLLETKAEESN